MTSLVFERAHDLFAVKSLTVRWRCGDDRPTVAALRRVAALSEYHVDDFVVVRAPSFHREQQFSPHRGQPTRDQ